MPSSNRAILPGFRLSLGYAVAYLSILVVLPLAACFVKAAQLSPARFLEAAWTPRAQAAYLLTFGASLTAAGVNVVFGVLVSWVLVRYTFPLKRLVDALVDLPFALPTAVAGLVYARLYVPTGWLGQFLAPLGIDGAYSRLGIVLVLIFTGFPFVVRTVQPVLQDFDPDVEEAAATLGAGRWQTFLRIMTPAAAFAEAVLTWLRPSLRPELFGEYGSVVFIAGNRPMDTEIAPVLIVAHLEAFNYAEATAVAVVLLTLSFTVLALVNLLERWSKRHGV